MSDFEDEYRDFLEEDIDPEEIFEMITIMPKRKIKMVAHLEDKDGDKITLAAVAKQLKEFIDEHMESEENTPINSQLFPLVNQMMISAVPRHVDLGVASFLFTASSTRHALSQFGLQIALLMRYINQHDLKIVTTEQQISDEELKEYYRKSREAEEQMFQTLRGGHIHPGDHNSDDFDVQ